MRKSRENNSVDTLAIDEFHLKIKATIKPGWRDFRTAALACSKTFGFYVVIIAGTLLGACNPHSWQQFHGDGPNRGFGWVRSSRTLMEKWPQPTVVGKVSYSSPVVGPDGT